MPSQVRARQIVGTVDDILDLSDDVDPDRDHIRGPDDALVTLLEYGDFECPYCGQAESVVRELMSAFDDDLRYVWRHLPLNDVHTSAQLAAEAAEAASAQGKFWEFYDALFAHQGTFTPEDLLSYAGELDLDLDRFQNDLFHHVQTPRVADDVASADASGVSGTPTFFINGRRRRGSGAPRPRRRQHRCAPALQHPGAADGAGCDRGAGSGADSASSARFGGAPSGAIRPRALLDRG